MKQLFKKPLSWLLMFAIVANSAEVINDIAVRNKPFVDSLDTIMFLAAAIVILLQEYSLQRVRNQADKFCTLAEDAVEALQTSNNLTKLVQSVSKNAINDLQAKNDALEEVIKTYKEAGKKPVVRKKTNGSGVQ